MKRKRNDALLVDRQWKEDSYQRYWYNALMRERRDAMYALHCFKNGKYVRVG